VSVKLANVHSLANHMLSTLEHMQVKTIKPEEARDFKINVNPKAIEAIAAVTAYVGIVKPNDDTKKADFCRRAILSLSAQEAKGVAIHSVLKARLAKEVGPSWPASKSAQPPAKAWVSLRCA